MISIVIPVYNVEEYLEKCVNSILMQTYRDFELILVNDGSTDSSGVICDEFEKKDSRVKAYHNNNKGAAEARNFGLKNSTQKYVWFIDSDDWLPQDALITIYNELEKGDVEMLSFSCLDYLDSDETFLTVKNLKRIETCNGREYLEKNNYMEPTPWLYIYSIKFLKTNNILFGGGRGHEDDYFNLLCFSKVNRIKKIPFELYYYRIRNNSIMTSPVSIERLECYLELISLCKELRNSNLGEIFIENKIYDYISRLVGLLHKSKIPNNEKKQFLSRAKKLIFKLKLLPNEPKGVKMFKILYNFNIDFYYRINLLRFKLIKANK